MIPQLPNDSKIRIAQIPGGYEVTRKAPLGGRWGRVLFAGFLFLWLIGWALAERDALRNVTGSWSGDVFDAIWVAGWTICGGLAMFFFLGILRKPRPVRLAIERNRLVWTPPYTWMTRWPRLRFWIEPDRRVAKNGSLTLLLSDVSSVTLHEPSGIDDSLMLLIECGGRSYQFEWLDENEAELRWLHAVLQSWKNAG